MPTSSSPGASTASGRSARSTASAASRGGRESEHDVFDGGHAGTGLSIAQGLATARDLRHGLERIAVVVGDAALMSGLSLEALNDIGHKRTQLLIVLNDNEMSISPTVGAFSTYLSKIKLQRRLAAEQDRLRPRSSRRSRSSAGGALEWSQRIRRSVVNLACPGQLFEDLGITYIGVVPGPRPPCPPRDVRAGPRAQGPGPRPRPDPEGPRLPARRDRPGLVPRRGPAADGPRPAAPMPHDPGHGPARLAPPMPHGAGSNGDALPPATSPTPRRSTRTTPRSSSTS